MQAHICSRMQLQALEGEERKGRERGGGGRGKHGPGERSSGQVHVSVRGAMTYWAAAGVIRQAAGMQVTEENANCSAALVPVSSAAAVSVSRPAENHGCLSTVSINNHPVLRCKLSCCCVNSSTTRFCYAALARLAHRV